ncbi:MAG: hypothetical protein JWQ88_3764, partial [Rhodoferax sp.]|nr:hypothetical protein [Rhodoferax sp.]
MKGVFGMIGLVLALVVVGLLVRSQLARRPLPTLPATGAGTTTAPTAPTATVAPASATVRAQAQRLPQ